MVFKKKTASVQRALKKPQNTTLPSYRFSHPLLFSCFYGSEALARKWKMLICQEIIFKLSEVFPRNRFIQNSRKAHRAKTENKSIQKEGKGGKNPVQLAIISAIISRKHFLVCQSLISSKVHHSVFIFTAGTVRSNAVSCSLSSITKI